ncbi:MAG: iron-sulfur cluster repair di-iron protein [Prolixibacteraceae bacterium]|nr:iron-sulfur cluster repair di-iron protein [Prolixibacteraceae bacterium]
MSITSDTQVGEVVKLNFKTAQLFQENNIDYCCGGSKTISEACNEAGVKPEQLIAQLEKIAENIDPDSDYINNLTPDELCDYIVKRHHSYVKKNIPFLKKSLEKICDVHGEKHPELFEIKKLFDESAGDLIMHMQKEEIMLFPYIQKMVIAKRDGSPVSKSAFGSVTNPIRMMVSDHDTEGKRFDKIAELSGNYSLPDDACTTYEAAIKHLNEFESDLHRHIHLENNILFPKAIELETEFTIKNS